MAREILDVLVDLRDRRVRHAVATVVETEGSVSAKNGSKAVIDEHGKVVAGWVGGGCAESATCQAALESLSSGNTQMVDIDMTDEMLGVGMPCGGSMRVYVEPVMPKPTLWIMGHGRVAQTLCQMGDLMGLEVVVNDPVVEARDYPAASRLITDDIDYETLKPRADDYVVVATQHKGDHQSMKRALDSGAGYIALIASRKRARLVMEHLEESGYGPDVLDRIRAPAGLDLGARSPEEIALCVISEIVLLRRQGSGRPMRELRLEQTGAAAAAAAPAAAEGPKEAVR